MASTTSTATSSLENTKRTEAPGASPTRSIRCWSSGGKGGISTSKPPSTSEVCYTIIQIDCTHCGISSASRLNLDSTTKLLLERNGFNLILTSTRDKLLDSWEPQL